MFHPTLLPLCGREAEHVVVSEAGEVSVGIENGPQYWGTGHGMLELGEGALQTAWRVIPPQHPHSILPLPITDQRHAPNRFIINDIYCSELCLLYPPCMIAIAVIYLTLVLNDKTCEAIQTQTTSATPMWPRRHRGAHYAPTPSSMHRKPAAAPQQQQDFVSFMAGLRVSLPTVATMTQEILSLYTMWEGQSDAAPESALGQSATGDSAGTTLSPQN